MHTASIKKSIFLLLIVCGNLYADNDCDIDCIASRSIGELLAIELKTNAAFSEMTFDADEIHRGVNNVFNGDGSNYPSKKILIDNIEKDRASKTKESRSDIFLEMLQSDAKPGWSCNIGEISVSTQPVLDYEYFYLPVDDEDIVQAQLDLASAHTGYYIPQPNKVDDNARASRSSYVTVAFRKATLSSEEKNTILASCNRTESDETPFIFYVNSSERWLVQRFPLRGVVRGWRDAISKMHEKEVGILAVGPSNAYGENDSESNTDILIYQISLLKIH